MKLVVMIPAFNEEDTIGSVIREIPREIEGVDSVDVLVIDDGSTDGTAEAAREAGANALLEFPANRGLARAFKEGMDKAIEMDADVVVNIDADGQYSGTEIPKLIHPILAGEADIVLGSRFKGRIEYMPFHKNLGNRLATLLTRLVSGFSVSDAQTGFRAFSREAALRLNVHGSYTYVQETIIQAVHKRLKILEVPIEFRKRQGESRLIPNIFSYAKRAVSTILRTYTYYNPLKTFMIIGGAIATVGLILGLKVLIHFLQTGKVTPHLPTALLSGFVIVIGFLVLVLGIIADMHHHTRYLVEEVLYRLKEREK